MSDLFSADEVAYSDRKVAQRIANDAEPFPADLDEDGDNADDDIVSEPDDPDSLTTECKEELGTTVCVCVYVCVCVCNTKTLHQQCFSTRRLYIDAR